MFFLRFGASGKGAPTARDIRIMYKILTGNTLDVAEEENAEVTDIGVNALLEVDIGETRRGGKDQETEPKTPHPSGEMVFSCSDRNIVIKYAGSSRKIESKKNSFVLDHRQEGDQDDRQQARRSRRPGTAWWFRRLSRNWRSAVIFV